MSMRKLYSHTKGKIHPSPPPTTTPHLSLLPAAIATLAAALSPEDQEVLAYLLSTSKPTNNSATNHPPLFNCNCFTCYTAFWVRWDASPNQNAIHQIIDAYEDRLIHNKKNSKKDRKNNPLSSSSNKPHAPQPAAESVTQAPPPPQMETKNSDDEAEDEKGSVRKIVSFIGGRIWGVWGI